MKVLQIIGLSISAAILYGIVHDQITARICVEYFTIGHVRLIASHSPTVLGLFWGVVATWWVGLPLGGLLALAARAGSRRQMEPRGMIRPLGKLLAAMFACATLAGGMSYLLTRTGEVELWEPFSTRIAADRQGAFLICVLTHSASYLAGVIGGLVLCVSTWRRRSASEGSIQDEKSGPVIGPL